MAAENASVLVEADAASKAATIAVLRSATMRRIPSTTGSSAGPSPLIAPTGADAFSGIAVASLSPAVASASDPGAVLVPRYAPDGGGVEDVDVRSPLAFQRVEVVGPSILSSEQKEAAALTLKALAMRDKHVFRMPAYNYGPFNPSQFPSAPTPRTIPGVYEPPVADAVCDGVPVDLPPAAASVPAASAAIGGAGAAAAAAPGLAVTRQSTSASGGSKPGSSAPGRRMPPAYTPFAVPTGPPLHSVRHKWRRGVMEVHGAHAEIVAASVTAAAAPSSGAAGAAGAASGGAGAVPHLSVALPHHGAHGSLAHQVSYASALASAAASDRRDATPKIAATPTPKPTGDSPAGTAATAAAAGASGDDGDADGLDGFEGFAAADKLESSSDSGTAASSAAGITVRIDADAGGSAGHAGAVPSREWMEGVCLDDAAAAAEEGSLPSLFPVPSFEEYHADYLELW